MVYHWTSFALYGSIFLAIPRTWYFSDFKYTPMRLFLLRGGRVLKVESNSISADKYVYWLEGNLVRPLTQDKLNFDNRDEADFLTQ